MNMLYENPTDFKGLDELVVEDSQFDFYLTEKTQEEVSLQYNVSHGHSLKINIIDFLPQSIRFSLTVNLAIDSSCEIQIASLCTGGTEKVFSFDVNHLDQRSYSRTKMAGINLSDGTLRFLGKSFIKNGAHQSDTRQEGKITNLSPFSKSECSPSLLIKENDVKASHGAALGAYNPDVLYYLMSRGLSMEESKKLITFGNLLPIIESFENKDIVEKAKKSLGDLSL